MLHYIQDYFNRKTTFKQEEEEDMAHLKTLGKHEPFHVRSHDDYFRTYSSMSPSFVRSAWKEAKEIFNNPKVSVNRQIEAWIRLQVCTLILRTKFGWNKQARRPWEDVDGYFESRQID